VFSISAFKACGFERIPRKEEMHKMTVEKRREVWEYYGSLFEGHYMPDEAKQAVEPMVVGEYRLFDDFVPDKNEKVFDVPITAFHGKWDVVCSEVEVRTWKPLTTGPFKAHILDGSHMFLHADECQDELLKLIIEDLETYVTPE
jgi:surfactin synthase thioesterase subunit